MLAQVSNSQIFTKFPPNTPSPDVVIAYWLAGGSDPRNAPGLNLPCTPGSTSPYDYTAASRSRHPGGVNVGLCDGSVHFVTDAVSIAVWQALGSIAGGEPVATF